MQFINYSKRQSLKLLLLFMIAAGLIPWASMDLGKVWPLFDIMLVFVISLYRGEEYSNSFLFIAGVIKDTLFGLPIGMSSLLYIVLHEAVMQIREDHARDAFRSVWQYFAVFSGGICIAYWLLLSISYYQLLPIYAIVVQWLLTQLLYPLLHEACSRLLQHIPYSLKADAE